MLRNRESDTTTADRLEEMVRDGKSKLRRRNDAQSGVAVEEPRAHHASAAPEIQEQALAQMESMLERLERDIERRPEPKSQDELDYGARKHIEDVVSELQSEVQRLSREVARLSAVAVQPPAARTHSEPEPQARIEKRPAPPAEPQFRPGSRPVNVILAGVPSFEALMDVQRALSDLQQAAGVSVIEFENGEASLHVELRSPVSARHVAAGLRSSAGRQFLIEESRPDEHRLRLRFIDHDERHTPLPKGNSRLRPELWAKA